MDRAAADRRTRVESHLTARPVDRPIVGIVLAGGRSSRFGSDKLAAEIEGRPLVLRAIEALRAVPGLLDVVVVGPARPVEPSWAEDVERAGARLVRDDEPFGGPLAGLVVGLRACPPDAIAIVVAGDMPDLDPRVLAKLGDAVSEGAHVAFLASGARNHPLPVSVGARAGLATAERLLRRDERSLRAFLASFEWSEDVRDFDEAILRDVDVPDDLR